MLKKFLPVKPILHTVRRFIRDYYVAHEINYGGTVSVILKRVRTKQLLVSRRVTQLN